MWWISVLPVLLGLAGGAPDGPRSGTGLLPEQWTLDDPHAEFVSLRSGPALYLRSGTALLRESVAADGVLEVEVSGTGPAGYAAVVLRAGAGREGEELRVRPQRSGLPGAVEHDGAAAAAELPRADGWVRLRVVVRGEEARVYVGGATEPSLVLTGLEPARDGDRVGLRARDGALFANFRYTPLAAGG